VKQAKSLIQILIVVCFFTTSTFSYAAEVNQNEEKGQMPPGAKSIGNAKDKVENKNNINEAEKEQSDKKNEEDSENSEKDEEEEEKSEKSPTLKTQASQSDSDTIQGWLEDLLDRTLNLNNPSDEAILDFWTNLIDQGYSLNQVQSFIDTVGVLKVVDLENISDLQALLNWAKLSEFGFTQLNIKMMVILADVFMRKVKDNLIHRDLDVTVARDVKIIAGWAQYIRQGYSAKQVYNLFKNQMTPSIKSLLLGSFNIGFFTYMAEEALSKINGGLDYICNLIDAMVGVRDAVENLVGPVDILNAPYEDNGFLTYWAEQAMDSSIAEVNKILYIWSELLDYWTGEVETLVDGGMSLEDAIAAVIDLILQPEPVVYDELIPYIEDLLGIVFDEDDPQHMGFLTYWSQQADIEGLANIEHYLLQW